MFWPIPPCLRAAVAGVALLSCLPATAQQPGASEAPPDLTRLANPEVAAELQLTDEQRAQIAQLLQNRAEALSTADQDQRDQQTAKVDAQLAEVLTAEQKQRFATLPGQAKLRFNFRDQNWVDVLDWFARQAGLSLVINQAPPGTFTYSDTKSYSPTEALDLLNGVLSTRKFALIRRERMLICADLSDGLPEGLIPQVRLEDLDKYGDFELVQVTFPLGGRPVQAVSDEVQPLLEPSGKVTILPQSKQALVTALAGKMRAVSAVIASIPEPRKERPPEPKPPAPKPELVIYPVDSLDLEATVEMLNRLVGDAQITIDQQAGQLNVFATPDKHAAIKKYLDEMSSPTSPDRQARLEVYTLEREADEDFIDQLKDLAPGAKIVADTDPPRLAIYARPEQHAKLQELLGMPTTSELESGDRQAEVYTLQHASPAELAAVIENLLPKSEVATDTEGGRVVVVASAAQHAVLRQMIQQFDASPAADRQLKYYPLPEGETGDLQNVLQTFVPKATIQLQADPRRLMVIATASEQETIERLLTQLSTTSTDVPQKKLRVYTVTPEQRRQFVSTYKQIAPELTTIAILETSRPDELQVVGREQQLLRVAELLQELKEQFPEELRHLKFYDVTAPLRSRFMALKDQLAPELREVQLIEGDQPDRMGLVATDIEHARAADLLQQLRSELPVEEPGLKVYAVTPTQRKRFLALLPSLQNELPGIRIVETSLPTELTIWARPAQHQRIDDVLKSLVDAETAPSLELVAYPVEQGDPTSIQTILQELYPDTKIVADQESGRVLVWTTAAEHAQIGAAVKQMDTPAAAGKNKMVYYKLGEIDARDVVQMFQELAPKMSLVPDRDTNSIIAWGSEKDHELLAKTVEDFRQQAGQGRRTIVSYPYGNRSTRDVAFLLQDLVPDARFTGDRTRRMIIAWATPEEHELIQQAMLKLTGGEAEGDGELRVYTVTRMTAADVVEALQQIAPSAQISVSSTRSQILVWADAATHDLIRAAIDKIEAGDPEAEQGAVRVYQAPPEILTRVKGLLPQVAPQAQPIPDTQVDRLTVWALPHEHTAIDELLKSLQTQLEPADWKLATYKLQRASAAEAQQLLQTVVPDLQFLTSAEPSQLLVRARSADQELIKKTLDELEQVLAQPQSTEVKVYSLGKMAPATLTPLLDPQLTAGLSLIPDPERKALVVRASAEQHERLKAAIDEILTRLADAPEKISKVYRLQHADPASARLTLLQLLPESAIVVDLATRSLVANAVPADQERIGQFIEQLDQPADDQRETVVYRLEHGDVTALLTTLRSLLPEAVMGIDSTSRTLVATATKEDQARIRQVVQQMDDPSARVLETKVYHVDRISQLYSLRYSLRSLSPDVIVVPDEQNGLLVVTARPEDQEQIATILEQLNDPQATLRETKVYRFKYADPASVRLTLSQLLPRSLLSVDVPTSSLTVNALPDDHERIAELIKQLDQPSDSGRETVVYRVEEGDVTALYGSLASLLPKATFGIDRSSRTLVATATKEEHEQIRKVVEQMDDPAFSAVETKVYRVEMGEMYSLRYALRNLSPEAVIVTDEENGLLVVTASPGDQKKFEAVVNQLNDPAATQRETKVYRLQAGELYGVRQALRAMLPRASIAIDDENRAVMVTASTEDQVRVQQVLEELQSSDADTRETKSYRLRYGDVRAAERALERLLPQAVITADEDTRAILATASKADHLRIDAAIQQLDVAREDPTETRVYDFQIGDVEAAQTVLESLLPEAVFAVDPENKLLVATASPQEHERIQVTVKELDRPNAEQPSLQAYRITNANFQSVFTALEDMFRRETEVRISADPENQTILVKAPPEEHRTIAQVVSQMENSADGSLRRRLVVYPLKGDADDSLLSALQDLFANQEPAVELSLDTASDQVLAVATEKQHELIRGAIEQMQGSETVFEVFPLQTMDPFFAELAIDRLYAEDPEPPVANGDSETQQLVVRGTRKQLDEIRQLLTKMGELPDAGSQTTKGMRVIPFRGDVQDAVQQIERVWPRLRDNPLRVVQPPRVLTPQSTSSLLEQVTPPASDAPTPPQQQTPAPAPPETPPPTTPSAPSPSSEDQSAQRDLLRTLPVAATVVPLDPPKPTANTDVAAKSTQTAEAQPERSAITSPQTAPPTTAADPIAPQTSGKPGISSASSATAANAAPTSPTPPPAVLLVPGQDSITVMSQDPEALSQIESLLRTLSRQYSLETSGGNFTVYTLKNAGASEVAQTLEKLFENMPFTTRGSFSRVAIVADERLNALIVHGRPNDRGLIAELLQVLDSSNVSELFISGPPVIVPLQHTDAARVMEILQGVYASQLKSGGTGPRINIPRGIPSEVATALQQMNAAAAGPLLTLQVDDVTNSIVILAPKVLAEEVSALVQQLDQRAEAEDTRRIGIVPLKSAKAEQLQEALQDLLRGPRRRRGP